MDSKTLGDIADVLVGYAFKSNEFNEIGEGVHLVRGKNVTKGTLRFGSDERWWTDFSDSRISKYYLCPGDVVIGMDGSRVGENFAQISENDLPALLVQRVACLRPRTGYSPDYIYALVSTGAFTRYVEKVKTGTTIPHISAEQIKDYPVNDLDSASTYLIGCFASSLKKKIELNNRLNDYLYELCRAKLQSFLEEADGLTTVDNCCDRLYSGGTPTTSKPEYWNGGLPWLSSGETGQRFIIDTEKTITALGAEKSSTKLAYSGDIVMASAGQGFTRGQTSMIRFDTYVNQSVLVIHPKKSYGAFLLLQLGNSYDMLRAWSDSTSTRGSIPGKLLRLFELPKLDHDALKELEEFCTPNFALIESNLRESKHIAELRDALLPKLLSGEIDVSEVGVTDLEI